MTTEAKAFIETIGFTEAEYMKYQVKGHEINFSGIISDLLYRTHIVEGTSLYREIKEAYPKELAEGKEQIAAAIDVWEKEQEEQEAYARREQQQI